MTTNGAPLTTAAYDDLLAALAEVKDGYALDPERHFSPVEVVEAFRYVTHLVSQGIECFAEADPERPRFSSIVTPARKFLGDNADSIYFQAVIRGDRAYRIRGKRTGQAYISFTVHGPDPTGGYNGPVQADINDRDLDIGPDGSYELILSPAGQAGEHAGTVIGLQPDARLIVVRNYFEQEVSAHNDPDIAIPLSIEPLVDPGPPAPLDDATYAQRLHDVAAFVRATSVGLRNWEAPSTAPFSANEMNAVGTPWSFRQSNIPAAGAVDIHYSSGRFDLAPDEALVMEGVMPPGCFTNVVLWNVHMQTFDYRHHRSSLNREQMVLGPDRSYRLVISAQDPGVPNWISTEGHRRGTIFWRFLLPDADPETPRCRVVKVAEVASLA